MIESLRAKIKTIEQEALATIQSLKNLREFQECKARILGRKGVLTEVLKNLGGLAPQERPVVGKLINDIKQAIEAKLEEAQSFLEQGERETNLKAKSVDITLPGLELPRGFPHPIRQVMSEVETIFLGMGFAIYEGPDVETDYYNFEALNFPKEHPARDMQDTFYISRQSSVVSRQKESDDSLTTHNSRLTTLLLRTHTSPVQIRVMEKHKPPLYMIAPGTVYRHDDDVTHSPMFHQVEGLMVDTQITFGDLKGVLSQFCRAVFGEKRKIRFRPSFFPFVEPGAEVDISCELCKGKPHHLSAGRMPASRAGQVVGKGCRVCGGDGWLEILGAGMVHPAVFENVNIDSKKYSGFAFGMGLERIAMLKFGIDDIRLFFQSDLRFLEQLA